MFSSIRENSHFGHTQVLVVAEIRGVGLHKALYTFLVARVSYEAGFLSFHFQICLDFVRRDR